LILFGEGGLSRTLTEFSAHYHGERNLQGKDNKLLKISPPPWRFTQVLWTRRMNRLTKRDQLAQLFGRICYQAFLIHARR
jgi:hypothetical protein